LTERDYFLGDIDVDGIFAIKVDIGATRCEDMDCIYLAKMGTTGALL
jgi:hypothetical protein